MTVEALLALFSLIPHGELYARPMTERVAAAVAALPVAQEPYVNASRAAVEELLFAPNEPDSERFQRFVDILAVLLYYDGRSFNGCLAIAEAVNDRPGFSVYGVNSLAVIANYLRKGRPLPISQSVLRGRLQALERNETLSHNATECLRMLDTAYDGLH